MVPADLTIFAAKYLVFGDMLLAALVALFLLRRRPRTDWILWAVTLGMTLVLAFILARVGAALYNDPRPFSQDHVKPLIAHAADNGFPSDHGLLAASIVAAVLLLDPIVALPFVVLGLLVDWARVGAGIHHVVDMAGSTGFVVVALLIGYLLAPPITRFLLPHVPRSLLGTSGDAA